MIERLTGTIAARGPMDLVLDVGGVGYRLEVSLATSEALSSVPPGRAVMVLTYLHLTVANDANVRLFGFATEDERRLFRLLIPVKGVGPQTALRILSSGRSPDDVARAIASGDPKRIKAKGVGPKLAERIAIELKDKLAAFGGSGASLASGPVARPSTADRPAEEAYLALKSLEFEDEDARRLVARAREALGPGATAEELVREGLVRS